MPDEKKSAPILRPYVVHGTNIKDDRNKKVSHGGIAMLSLALARRYNEVGILRPYIPESDDDPMPTTSTEIETHHVRDLANKPGKTAKAPDPENVGGV